jgi:hypothetical protein
MAATAWPSPSRGAHPGLRLVGTRRPRPSVRTLRARRLAVVIAALVLLAIGGLVLRAAGGLLTHEPPAAPAKSPTPGAAYVVQPGDTVWSLARRLQPNGDVRPVVDRLVAAHGGTTLAVGEVIRLEER